MTVKRRVRIESEGHGKNTRVFLVDDDGEPVEVAGVTSVAWSAEPGEPATATLTFRAPEVSVVGELAPLIGSTDASVWAHEFCAMAKRLGYGDLDEGWMLGWFANAMCAQMDADRRKYADEASR